MLHPLTLMHPSAAFARTVRDPNAIIGADQVSEDLAKSMCAEIFDVLRTLRETRDMSVAEIKLVVSIEDPRTRERRAKADIEDSRGVSRDEMAAALIEVAEGRVPKDRIALKCLHEEIAEWPFLDINTPLTGGFSTASAADKESKPKTAPSDYAGLLKGGDTVVKPYIMGQEASLTAFLINDLPLICLLSCRQGIRWRVRSHRIWQICCLLGWAMGLYMVLASSQCSWLS